MPSFNFNKVIIGGRIANDFELKSTPSGISVTSFTVAVNRSYRAKNGEQPQADFINVTAWRQNAEFITRNFHKSSSICIVGSIQTRSYTDKQGQKRYATEVVADEAYFVDSKSEADNRRTASQNKPENSSFQYVPEQYMNPGAQDNFKEVSAEEEDSLPF